MHRKNKETKIWWISVAVIAVLRVFTMTYLPLNALNAPYDDSLMVSLARKIVVGKWLGEYNVLTLIKPAGYPLFLALCNILGLSVQITLMMIYIVSCLYFTNTFRGRIRTKWLIFVFLVLVFNPIMTATCTQRIYRSGLTIVLTLFVIGACARCILDIDNSKVSILPSINGGSAYALMGYTREDSIWLLPILFFALCIIVFRIWKTKKYTLSALALIPICIFILFNSVIAILNHHYYGLSVVTETSGTYFEKTLKALYSVEDEHDYRHVSVSRDKMNRIQELSPTLHSIKGTLDHYLDMWAHYDSAPDDGEVEDGWFYWSFRDAVSSAGYYSSQAQSEQFYEQVYNEIQEAVDKGLLSTRMVMPSALMSPWRTEYFKELPSAVTDAAVYMFRLKDIITAGSSLVSALDENSANALREFTKGYIITNDQSEQEDYRKKADTQAAIANSVKDIYSYLNYGLLVCFLVGMWKLIRQSLKKNEQARKMLFLEIGMIASWILLLIGVSYTHISAYYAISAMYLSSGYAVMFACLLIPSVFFLSAIFENTSKKRSMEPLDQRN